MYPIPNFMATYDSYIVANEASCWQILSEISIYRTERWKIRTSPFYDDILVS